MKLLWFSHFIPYPPVGGSRQRSFNLIRRIASSYEIALIAFNLENTPKEELVDDERELRKYCARVEFWDLPLTWRSTRWWVEFAVSPLLNGPFSSRAFWSREVAARWRKVLDEHAGALLHVDSSDLAFFTDSAANFRKVLNHHNCESTMADRRAQLERNPLKKLYLRAQAQKLEDAERAICHRFDVNTAVSESDAAVLQAINPKAHFHVVENGTDTTYFQSAHIPEEPKSLIFASSMRWYPNISAIEFFLRDIWPLLKQQCPGIHLCLAGNLPPRSVVEWAAREANVSVVASPADIRPWLDRAAVSICPVVDGGGTRLKILDAMAMGKAIVSTSVGCEGLRVTHGENILVADRPQEFAGAIMRLLENDTLRRRVGAAGRALVERAYSWERIAARLEHAYRCALNREACEEVVGAAVGAENDQPLHNH